MKKTLIIAVALAFSANSIAADVVNPNYNFSPLSGNRILFGTGLPKWECRHIVYRTNGTQELTTYGFATADYGYCPGLHTNEYKHARNILFGPPTSSTDHNPNSEQCTDDPEDLGHGF